MDMQNIDIDTASIPRDGEDQAVRVEEVAQPQQFVDMSKPPSGEAKVALAHLH